MTAQYRSGYSVQNTTEIIYYTNKYYDIRSSTSQIPHPNDLLVPNNIYTAI